MGIKRADWVTCKNSTIVGVVQRVARDGSWADVNWGSHSKRMQTRVLEVQHTIQRGDWQITDETRRAELEGAEEVPNLGERFQLVVREKEGDAHASR